MIILEYYLSFTSALSLYLWQRTLAVAKQFKPGRRSAEVSRAVIQKNSRKTNPSCSTETILLPYTKAYEQPWIGFYFLNRRSGSYNMPKSIGALQTKTKNLKHLLLFPNVWFTRSDLNTRSRWAVASLANFAEFLSPAEISKIINPSRFLFAPATYHSHSSQISYLKWNRSSFIICCRKTISSSEDEEEDDLHDTWSNQQPQQPTAATETAETRVALATCFPFLLLRPWQHKTINHNTLKNSSDFHSLT